MKLPRSRLSPAQTERLLEHFVAGTPARPAAELVGVNRNTARYFYQRLRARIARRLPGHRAGGVGAAAFGLCAERGKVRAVPLSRDAPPPPALDAIVTPVARRGRAVVYARDLRLRRLKPSPGAARIDRIESFWSQAKRLLRKYNGMPLARLPQFLAECEWRFNFGPPRRLRQVLRRWLARA